MMCSSYRIAFTMSIALCVLVLAAGCSQAGSSVKQIPSPEISPTVPAPATLLLTAADIPAGYTLTESRVKTPADVGEMAKSLGWESGYIVRFTGPAGQSLLGPTEITQTITRYQSRDIGQIAALIEKNDKTDSELTFTTLPSPGIGTASSAFTGKAIGQIVVRTDPGNPMGAPQGTGSFKQDMAEIIFAQGTAVEVLRMTGPDANITVLEDLARKAYGKLQ